MEKRTKPRMPEIGENVRLVGRLIRVETPPPIQPEDEYIFEGTSAAVKVLLNGREITDGGSFNDFYGDAVATAIKEAKQFCKDNGITKTSDLEVIVIKEKTFRRYHRSRDTTPYTYDKRFIRFDRTGTLQGIQEDHDEPVWSSKVDINPADPE